MIDSTPKALAHQRLGQLVHGLRERMNSSAQKMAEEIDQLALQIRQREDEHADQERELAEQQNEAEQICLTDWDESLNARWDDAELRSFKAVFDTATKEGQLRTEARKRIDQATVEVKKRIADIDARFMKAKDVPIKFLHEYRAANLNMIGELLEVEQAADAALAQHSLRAPVDSGPAPHYAEPHSSKEALSNLRAAINDAKVHYDRLTNHPLIRFIESFWFYAIGLLLAGLVTATLGLTQVLPWLFAALAGFVTAVIAFIVAYIGVRPWLKGVAAAEYPRVKNQVQHGRHLHHAGNELAVRENDEELKRLAQKRDERHQQAIQWRESQINEISHKLQEEIAQLRVFADQQKHSASTQLTTQRDATNQQFQKRMREEQEAASNRVAQLRGALETYRTSQQSEIERLSRGGAMRLHAATQKALRFIARSRRWCQRHFPEWSQKNWSAESWPEPLEEPILPIGNIRIDELVPAAARLDAGPQVEAPILFAPLADEYLTITGDPYSPMMQEVVRNLILRALTTLPPGRTQICVIDPPGLGRNFGWLMHLGDFDPQLVSHRVWTQPTHIVKQLSQLESAAEDFIQQSLRNRYKNIVEYNRDAGALAEPFRILVWSAMPSALDEVSWKSLQCLLDTGARCGIMPILLIDPTLPWPSPEHRSVLFRRGLHLKISENGKSMTADRPLIADLAIKPALMPDENHAQTVIQEVGRRALLANRVEVPLEKLIPPAEERWNADSSKMLEIPIGQSGVGRVHSLKLGVGTAQHAIVAGKTGSGKSSMLHAVITSAALKYSPDNFRLVLLDFKKGVEFQVYANCQLPHADIIGIESHREFGLSALEYVDGCLQRRGELFRSAGVQDIASWNVVKPDQHLPRMLVVIDEFQELFVEDDKLSNQASLILDRIVRQGRSFGVHALLSSQTLAGSYSLPRTTLGQMGVRIALQCDAADAQIIFADDNPAAARLKHPGQAVYNDAGGRIEGNQPMQIGWLSKQQQEGWLSAITTGYQNKDYSTNILGRCVVYDGNRAASWNSENAGRAIAVARQNINADAIWCVAGESVAISPAVVFPLTSQAGRNVLIVGGDDSEAAAVINSITHSFVRHAKDKSNVQIFAVQGAKPTDAKTLQLPEFWKALPCQVTVADTRNADELLTNVHAILKKRLDDPDSAESAHPVLLNLIQIGRMRTLRREDEFGLGSYGDSSLTADKILEEILRDGPSNNMHVVVWAENYSTLARWLSRTSLREFEIRALMQMSANDSSNLIDSVAASRLGEHVMLLHDDATGQAQGFRPFDPNTLTELKNWVQE